MADFRITSSWRGRDISAAAIFWELGSSAGLTDRRIVRGPRRLAMPAADDGVQFVGQLGDEMLPVPGELGLGKELLLNIARQVRPDGDHRRTQPAHQALFLGRIAKLLVFHKWHAATPLTNC